MPEPVASFTEQTHQPNLCLRVAAMQVKPPDPFIGVNFRMAIVVAVKATGAINTHSWVVGSKIRMVS